MTAVASPASFETIWISLSGTFSVYLAGNGAMPRQISINLRMIAKGEMS